MPRRLDWASNQTETQHGSVCGLEQAPGTVVSVSFATSKPAPGGGANALMNLRPATFLYKANYDTQKQALLKSKRSTRGVRPAESYTIRLASCY